MFPTFCECKQKNFKVADSYGWLGGGGGDPDPEIRGDPVSKIFVLPFGVSVWSKNKRGLGGGSGRAGPQGPSPGSATAFREALQGPISPKFKHH